MNDQLARIEALIYVTGDTGISLEQLSKTTELAVDKVQKLVEQLAFKYQSDDQSALQLIHYDQRYQITTKMDFDSDLKRLFGESDQHILTQASLEGLTIIAYNQPITRVEVDEVRGVNSSAIIQKLLKQGLIQMAGKKDVPGTPLLYKTTDLFLNLFGLNDLNELPPMDLDSD
ncbi:SMC-Scp complex subunit ScpB [Lactobacillaceae bacterium Scapto_B20]